MEESQPLSSEKDQLLRDWWAHGKEDDFVRLFHHGIGDGWQQYASMCCSWDDRNRGLEPLALIHLAAMELNQAQKSKEGPKAKTCPVDYNHFLTIGKSKIKSRYLDWLRSQPLLRPRPWQWQQDHLALAIKKKDARGKDETSDHEIAREQVREALISCLVEKLKHWFRGQDKAEAEMIAAASEALKKINWTSIPWPTTIEALADGYFKTALALMTEVKRPALMTRRRVAPNLFGCAQLGDLQARAEVLEILAAEMVYRFELSLWVRLKLRNTARDYLPEIRSICNGLDWDAWAPETSLGEILEHLFPQLIKVLEKAREALDRDDETSLLDSLPDESMQEMLDARLYIDALLRRFRTYLIEEKGEMGGVLYRVWCHRVLGYSVAESADILMLPEGRIKEYRKNANELWKRFYKESDF